MRESGSVKITRDRYQQEENSESKKRKVFNGLSSSNDTSSSWLSEQGRSYYSHSLSFKLSSLNGNYLNEDEYGSLAKEIQALTNRRNQMRDRLCAQDPRFPPLFLALENGVASGSTRPSNDEQDENTVANPVIIIDSDDDEDNVVSENCSDPSPGIIPEKPFSNLLEEDLAAANTKNDNSMPPVVTVNSEPSNIPLKDSAACENSRPPHHDKKLAKPSRDLSVKQVEETCPDHSKSPAEVDASVALKYDSAEDKGVYVGTDEESGEVSGTKSDGLDDIWGEMNMALESTKGPVEDAFFDDGGGGSVDCDHLFVVKDDIGEYCRICGFVRRGIERIIEYNFSKANRSTRTYANEECANYRELNQRDHVSLKRQSDDLYVGEITPHPRHGEVMKPHQVEGFKFLESNLITDNPGGCIMAHAPGSGKTFMIISFLQSFMAKYPTARPLVVLPKGLLGIWRTEFKRWQVEDIPLYDFYSAKADNRIQQRDVLLKWVKERSILFLGYSQFTTIMRDDNEVNAACQEYLLKVPTILILDEGHTPRNKETDILNSLTRIVTPRKVVLSGTLYQNHVGEVFNILNLVRPKFLRMDTSKALKKRMLSSMEITGKRSLSKNDGEFYELIEHALAKDENHKRRMTVIKDLREMTRHVLHYYKGDSLGELPGLVDFSVFLRLSEKQEAGLEAVMKASNNKFIQTAKASPIYLHPLLKDKSSEIPYADIDVLLQNFNVREGAKANFYLNLLKFCASSGEKLLVFSQNKMPLRFLVRMTSKLMGYTLGREMFIITGDTAPLERDSSMAKFNNSSEARVFFGSIKACGEGISLVGASRIIMLDIHLNPSVTRQALGRAFRPGQVRKVYTYRLVASGSIEEEDHAICCRKESIAKLWFEWDHQSSGPYKPEVEEVNVKECDDDFLETTRSNEDVVSLYKR